MARKIVVDLVDDLDGSVIEAGEGEHITFSVNGVDYEIDLKTKNAREFLKTMEFYIDHATKVGSRKRPTAKAGAARSRSQAREVREWATANGYEVSARGRIPADVQEAFDAAH
ncbi:Lsr2 family protein (plasmid) [Rhodococcus sp. ZPP]|uniref:histone-like nucleoid-structuring protein Lsr2 n=1 Tax=Rhodococcus sp. ZPP TaxID=2749906 RepID=UPI001AD87D93|nr:Lsr2 family protein [Rhodococcus sp. ZPP]QTJ70575.1 Lsr2 family protein [Rhodococcus sp. ZPP]